MIFFSIPNSTKKPTIEPKNCIQTLELAFFTFRVFPAGLVIEFGVNFVGISKNLKIALPARPSGSFYGQFLNFSIFQQNLLQIRRT